MKNKVIASLLFITALTILFWGNISFNRKKPSSLLKEKKWISFASSQKSIDIYEEFDNIDEIELYLKQSNLKIISGDKLSLKASNVMEDSYNYRVEHNTLIVEENNSVTALLEGNPNYIITVPSDLSLAKIAADCSGGTIKLNDISAKEVILQAKKGSLEGFNLNAGQLNINAGMGSINLHNIVSQNIKIISGMGSINMDCKIEGDNGDIQMDSPMGSINLTLDNNPDDFYFDLAKRSSSININGKKAENNPYYYNDTKESKYHLIIGSGISSVEINFKPK